jgi:uncharacterized protein
MQLPNDEQIIEQTKKWITDVVIGNNFCPFAAKPFNNNGIRYLVANYQVDIFESLILSELQYLDQHKNVDTTLIIFPNHVPNFLDYLQIVEEAEVIVEANDYDGVYQVASFHPLYLFEGEPPNAPTHYTNRSPYPTLHILREEMVEKVIEKYPHNMISIPNANIAFTNNKGLEYMHQLWLNSFSK